MAQLQWTETAGTGPYGMSWDADGQQNSYRVSAYRPSGSGTGFKVEELIENAGDGRIEHQGSEDGAKAVAQDWEDNWK